MSEEGDIRETLGRYDRELVAIKSVLSQQSGLLERIDRRLTAMEEDRGRAGTELLKRGAIAAGLVSALVTAVTFLAAALIDRTVTPALAEMRAEQRAAMETLASVAADRRDELRMLRQAHAERMEDRLRALESRVGWTPRTVQ
ncbi:MAG TPA: hypothetical protein VNK52_16175 [Hyphomicrobiaceae bacterium]|nr:hypothetical protein [Hyphomicrobiaceae bacterium]